MCKARRALSIPSEPTRRLQRSCRRALRFNGAGVACSHSGAAPDVVDCGIALTAAHLDAAQGVAGFGGLAYYIGGASIINGGF